MAATSPVKHPSTTFGAFRSMPGNTQAEPAPFPTLPADIDRPAWRDRIIAANVQAKRVASPDLLAQLEQASQNKIDTIICSVLDTDPSVPFNAMVAESYTAEMAAGLALLSRLTGTKRIWITADPDKPAGWFAGVRLRILNPGLKLVPLRADYPQTDPTLMLFTLLQRRITPHQLPTEKGALLIDTACAVILGQCSTDQFPVQKIPLAIRDHFQQRTHLVEAPMNTRLADVCDFLELPHNQPLFRSGDFLRDQWISADTPLGHGELIIHATAPHLNANPDPCIRCGWCLEACPTRIHPAGLLDAAQQQNPAMAKKFGLNACIECGICSYVCPTRLPLLSAIRSLNELR